MEAFRRFQRRVATQVVAIQLTLDMDTWVYQKWGDQQTARPGDWLINNAGDVYTVGQQSFAATYQQVSEGIYEKTTDVWACRAPQDGSVQTNEGITHYKAGDYLVANDPAGKDKYAISAEKFHQLYAPVGTDQS